MTNTMLDKDGTITKKFLQSIQYNIFNHSKIKYSSDHIDGYMIRYMIQLARRPFKKLSSVLDSTQMRYVYLSSLPATTYSDLKLALRILQLKDGSMPVFPALIFSNDTFTSDNPDFAFQWATEMHKQHLAKKQCQIINNFYHKYDTNPFWQVIHALTGIMPVQKSDPGAMLKQESEFNSVELQQGNFTVLNWSDLLAIWHKEFDTILTKYPELKIRNDDDLEDNYIRYYILRYLSIARPNLFDLSYSLNKKSETDILSSISDFNFNSVKFITDCQLLMHNPQDNEDRFDVQRIPLYCLFKYQVNDKLTWDNNFDLFSFYKIYASVDNINVKSSDQFSEISIKDIALYSEFKSGKKIQTETLIDLNQNQKFNNTKSLLYKMIANDYMPVYQQGMRGYTLNVLYSVLMNSLVWHLFALANINYSKQNIKTKYNVANWIVNWLRQHDMTDKLHFKNIYAAYDSELTFMRKMLPDFKSEMKDLGVETQYNRDGYTKAELKFLKKFSDKVKSEIKSEIMRNDPDFNFNEVSGDLQYDMEKVIKDMQKFESDHKSEKGE